jgi:hypothetical protein
MYARARLVSTVTFDERMYGGTGVVGRWVRGIGFQFHRNALKAAPSRTGKLRAGIVVDPATRVAPRGLTTTVRSTAAHSKYVHGGTAYQGRRFIYSNYGWANKVDVDRFALWKRPPRGLVGYWMKFSNPYGVGTYKLRVHGQRANPFLITAFNRTAATHPALVPMAPRFHFS